ncbi:MAG: 4-hydroxy-tetrahydrodipicolinate reductase [Oscillospiraceae bacterium]|nr:4-hydroxy-tetrahydrodipicolinate reductase [Oscillospiraceae bacterium]
MINIVLSGACGKMGRVIAELVGQRSDSRIVAGVDVAVCGGGPDFPVYKKIFDLKESADVVIDFSHPSTLSDLLTYCKMKNLPLVAATTGYSKDEVSNIKSAAAQIPVFFTGNMSLGINLLQDLARRAARVLGEQFDVEIIEKHHNLKKDAPSGTAHMLAESVNEEFADKKRYVYDRHNALKAREKNEIGMHAIRGGTIVGEHEVVFAGHDEVVTLSHSALSKEVFAVGAINAAIFLKNQPRGLYDMSHLLKSL